MLRLAPFLLAACTPQVGDLPGSGDSARPPDSGEPPHSDSSADSAAPEQVGAVEGDWLEGLCQLDLDCEQELSATERAVCQLRVRSEDGSLFWNGDAETWIRGRSSRSVPKHQYRVELHDLDGSDAERNLLGMGDEADWILQGNYYDRSLLRSKLGFDLFQSFGGSERYAPQAAFCELDLNGEYRGVYTLLERIERDEDRVDIAASDSGESFVFKQETMECFADNPLAEGTCWEAVYPDEDAISAAQDEGLRAALDAWTAAARHGDPDDPQQGVFSAVDMDSAVDIVLLEELFKNEDFCWTSLHIWKGPEGLIHFAPWDLDMTLGQLWYYASYGDPEVWINYRPEMISAMAASPEFQQRLAERWAELRQDQLATEAILGRIDAYQAIMGAAIDRNWERWDITTVNYGSYFYQVTSYAEEDAWIRNWLALRLAWMDENIGSYVE